MYTSIEQAQDALDAAEQDVIADFGEEALDGCWGDIVHSVADMCIVLVAQELLTQNGLQELVK